MKVLKKFQKMNRPKKSTVILSGYSSFILFLLYAPLLWLLWLSFDWSGQGDIFIWYRTAFTDSEFLNALKNSVVIGSGATVLSTLLGTITALALSQGQGIHKKNLPGQKVFEAIIGLPLVLPEIVIGLSLLLWFVLIDFTLGTISVTLAHTTFCLPYVILMVGTRLKSLDPVLEEAASDLGATPWFCFWKITLPLIAPAILASALLAFTLSFDDFLITFFTAGPNSDTLPVRIYSMMRFGVRPEINAMASAVLAFTFVSVVAVGCLQKNE